MPDIVKVSYSQTGKSIETNSLGMREMQRRAFEYRGSRRLLIKAPPASGKSRALMFIALDKLLHQGVRKVVIAVPESAIGASFAARKLTESGFFADWAPDVDLTSEEDNRRAGERADQRASERVGENDGGKIQQFVDFMNSDKKILVCTHATFRFAVEKLETEVFKNCLVAIDEFHHASADTDDNRLGSIVRDLLKLPEVHLIAMTGSYFRGDRTPVLLPEDEEQFEKCTYTYYEQLNGYRYLKTLGIGYRFFRGSWLDALAQVLDTTRKTILHIPNVNSRDSTKDKNNEVGRVLDFIGEVVDEVVPRSNVFRVRRKDDGKIIIVADLVDDDLSRRRKTVEYLRKIRSVDEMDLIIALGMAKEGFDWPYCEHTLTVGYRGSLTEVVQIIGRCARDSENKTHAQFTNLILEPDADREETTEAVNNMLKAITCSLLMEQVLAPNFKFLSRMENVATKPQPGEIRIRGFKEPSTQRVREIVESDLNDLKAKILQDPDVQRSIVANVDPAKVNRELIPRVIREQYPDLDGDGVEEVRQYVVADSFVKNGYIQESVSESVQGGKPGSDWESDSGNDSERRSARENGDFRFIHAAGKFVDIDELSIDLIDSIHPFQKAWEILSKTMDKRTFRLIRDYLDGMRSKMSVDDALKLVESIRAFVKEKGREPEFRSEDSYERRLGEALLVIRGENRKREQRGK